MEYEHTQRGYTALIVLLSYLVLTAVLVALIPEDRGAVAISLGLSGILVLVVATWFSVLRIRVSNQEIRAWFGGGWPRKVIALDEVAAVRQVRNKWYYGWGIRRAPAGWMFSVWGLDAVEVDRTSGKKFLIGTNDPQELVSAIEQRMAARR